LFDRLILIIRNTQNISALILGMAFIFYYRQSKFNFNCDVCGQESVAEKFVDTCAKCSIQICEKCNRGGLCPSHFHELPLPLQQRAEEIGSHIQKLHQTRTWVSFLPCFVLPLIVFLIVTGVARDYFQIVVVLILLFSIPSLFTSFDILFTKSKLNQLRLQIRHLFATEANFFELGTNRQPGGMWSEASPIVVDNAGSPNQIICSNCKASNPLNARFCESCGKKIR
jgi:hypothetical protein